MRVCARLGCDEMISFVSSLNRSAVDVRDILAWPTLAPMADGVHSENTYAFDNNASRYRVGAGIATGRACAVPRRAGLEQTHHE